MKMPLRQAFESCATMFFTRWDLESLLKTRSYLYRLEFGNTFSSYDGSEIISQTLCNDLARDNQMDNYQSQLSISKTEAHVRALMNRCIDFKARDNDDKARDNDVKARDNDDL